MMKTTTFAALLGLAAANKQIDEKKMEAIVQGVLFGALDAEGFTDISTCIKDFEQVISDAESAYKDFEQKDVEHIIEGVKEVANLLETVKTGMSDCSSLKADWKKLEQMEQIFDNPKSFAYHVGKDILINGVEIYNEVSTAIEDYTKEDWAGYGYNLGKAAAKTILGEESQALIKAENKDKVARVMQGMLKPFGGKFNLEALLMCIYEEDQAALMFDVAVQSFETAW